MITMFFFLWLFFPFAWSFMLSCSSELSLSLFLWLSLSHKRFSWREGGGGSNKSHILEHKHWKDTCDQQRVHLLYTWVCNGEMEKEWKKETKRARECEMACAFSCCNLIKLSFSEFYHTISFTNVKWCKMHRKFVERNFFFHCTIFTTKCVT